MPTERWKLPVRRVEAGPRWVVDLDLEKFFTRVNHDVLMARVARKIGDKRVWKLIRRYLHHGWRVGNVEELDGWLGRKLRALPPT